VGRRASQQTTELARSSSTENDFAGAGLVALERG